MTHAMDEAAGDRVVEPSHPARRPPVPEAQHPLLGLQASAGNQAAVAALRQVQFSLEVGAADDPYEREADAAAHRVVAALSSGRSSPAGGPAGVLGASLASTLRRRADAPGQDIGGAGGRVDAGAEAQLQAARSGGSPLAHPQRQRLEQAFGGADFGDVRIHEGGNAADLNTRFGARAFTVGSDIFFRGPAPTLDTRAGSELLAHELAHTVQQDPRHARREVIRRDFVGTWDLTYAKLSAAGKLGYDQFVALNGSVAAERIQQGAKEKSGDHDGEYNTDKAEGIWSKKAMDPAKFDEALKKKQARESDDVKGTLKTMNGVCNETDGTHRPGSVGDGTSEWALKWEAAHGEPFRSPSGHALKLRDYCKVLSEGLDTVASKKSSVPSGEKMMWTEHNGAAAVEVEVLAQASLVVTRATDRLAKMRSGVKIWNNRIATYPDKWNSDGTSKVPPPGVEPDAKNKLEAGWPKDKVVQEY